MVSNTERVLNGGKNETEGEIHENISCEIGNDLIFWFDLCDVRQMAEKIKAGKNR